jgi:sulfur carrier protein
MQSAAATTSVKIQVNGEPRDVPRGCTLEELLVQLDLVGRRVALALNREVVPRGRYADVAIQGSDRIEILEAVGGG